MRKRKYSAFTISFIGLSALALTGCVSADITPIAQDTVLISADAAPACGGRGARKVAFQQAAAETLRRGYDKFVIVGADSSNSVRVVGTTPVYGTTNVYGAATGSSFYGTGTTTFSGGQPIIGGSHGQQFAIKMFRHSDAAAANAIDARAELGPEWEQKIREKTFTCF